MSQQTWPVPYTSRLEGSGVQPGQCVIIKAAVLGEKGDNMRFSVNLKSGPNDGDSCQFHMSARMDDNKFIFNTFENGEWAKEERSKNKMKEGDPFDIRIRAHDSHFEVFVDRRENHNFEYRQPLSRVTHLYIEGGIALHSVNWGGKYYPVPYQAGIDGGLRPGKRLCVSGILEQKGKAFAINLLQPNGDIALQVNPRFDEKVIVRNAEIGGSWGSEEREGKLPIEKKEIFDIIIVNETYAFQVFLNGEHFTAFAHRTDPDNINGVRIDGDVELHGVHVK